MTEAARCSALALVLALGLPGGVAGGVAACGSEDPPARAVMAVPVSIEMAGTPDQAILYLELSRIDNPAMTPFGLIATTPDGIEIGRIAIYPADQTGTYALGLEGAALAALRAAGAVALELDFLQGHPAEIDVAVSARLK